MRIGALLLVGFGFLAASACTTANPPDEECIVNQGTCFLSTDMVGCANILPYGCAANYTCCSATNASNIVDGAVVDVVITPFDTGTGADGASDASVDAPVDGSKKPDATVASEGGTKDSGGADAKDATTRSDSGGTVTKDAGTTKDSGVSSTDAAKSHDSSADVAHDAPDAG
jgi:hypothetical protein